MKIKRFENLEYKPDPIDPEEEISFSFSFFEQKIDQNLRILSEKYGLNYEKRKSISYNDIDGPFYYFELSDPEEISRGIDNLITFYFFLKEDTLCLRSQTDKQISRDNYVYCQSWEVVENEIKRYFKK